MKRKHTDNTLECLLMTLFIIPICIYFIIKWFILVIAKFFMFIFSCCCRNRITLSEFEDIDNMDGLVFENYFSDLLRNNGYKSVKTTKATGDYGIDVLARKGKKKYAFQCKRYNSNVGVNAIQEAYAGAASYNADISVVVTNSYFTPNAIELARKLSVLLWDRNTLYKMIKKNSINDTVQKNSN